MTDRLLQELMSKLGLTKKQGQTYGCLFSLGTASAADIAQRTGINRTLIYDHLNTLVEKGMVSVSQINNKRAFTALHPRTLAKVLEDKNNEEENRRRTTLKDLKELLPNLERQFNMTKRISASILMGQKGVHNLFQDVTATLKKGQEDLVFIANHEGRELLGTTIKKYYAQSKRKGIRIRVIFDSRPQTVKIASETARLPNVKVKYLPASYSTLTTFHVYGSKVSLLLFSEGEVFGLLIDNQKIAASLKKHFEALWKMAANAPVQTN
ncbi:hypothetical protein HZC09_00395 [Candidatus Micrarchaeota archaeon]|nr:hypothetical protein [Candidatus Micrarchaeota archaeon]